jgi:hypothetical protein
LAELNLEIFPPKKDPNKAPNGPPKEKPITPPNKLPQIDIIYFSNNKVSKNNIFYLINIVKYIFIKLKTVLLGKL